MTHKVLLGLIDPTSQDIIETEIEDVTDVEITPYHPTLIITLNSGKIMCFTPGAWHGYIIEKETK